MVPASSVIFKISLSETIGFHTYFSFPKKKYVQRKRRKVLQTDFQKGFRITITATFLKNKLDNHQFPKAFLRLKQNIALLAFVKEVSNIYHSSLAETHEGSTSEQSCSASNARKKIFNRLYHIPFLRPLRLKIAPFRSVEEISERPSLHGRLCS